MNSEMVNMAHSIFLGEEHKNKLQCIATNKRYIAKKLMEKITKLKERQCISYNENAGLDNYLAKSFYQHSKT